MKLADSNYGNQKELLRKVENLNIAFERQGRGTSANKYIAVISPSGSVISPEVLSLVGIVDQLIIESKVISELTKID